MGQQMQFKGWLCNLQYGEYPNGRLGIALTDAEDGGPVGKLTVNIPEAELAKDEVCVKDYSENEGMLEAAVAAGIVSEPLRHVASGFVTVPVCKLLVEVPDGG